ncbi:MAG: efflux RND transporter periplasmic adaptor subunit [Alphaproteobacteria bacterium PRO2]|nr:efflux RND transporter periplasmic adaptor subunit [Alphaproteobacteria bacterium PRO2]
MKKILLPLIVLAALAAGFLAIQGRNESALETVRPVRGPAVQAVYATGTVEPTVMMPIAPRSTARLMSLQADEGHIVKKGDVLGQLEDSDIQNQLEEVRARAEFAEKDYARKAELLKRGAISKGTADQSKADLDAARASVERIKAQLGYMQLIAPEDGLVMRRDGEVGELIPANQPVFWLSCCAPLRISAEVDEEDIALVKASMPVLIRADAFPGKDFRGKVDSITPKGDAVSRSYRVRIGIEGQTPLMTGMTAETNILISETKDALLVPTAAVKSDTVWVVQDGKLARRTVETGAKTPSAVEIRSGITAEDVVVLDPGASPEEGQNVHIKMTDWKAP